MSFGIGIRVAAHCKRRTVHPETYQAIKRAIRVLKDDKAVAAYAAAPHENVTAELVASVRARMIRNGEIRAAKVVDNPGGSKSWRSPLAGNMDQE